ncbi:MAG TPA: hypothetical protein VHO29_04605 [Marmoricola sp.]|nr:hypothetical protein [Marmoricola sp.]
MDGWTLGVSIAALVVAISAAVFTGLQASAAKKANSLTERALARAEEAEREQREANRVRWVVERVKPGYALRNVGTDTAHDVQAWKLGIGFISGPIVIDEDDPRREWLRAESLQPNGSMPFTTAPRSAYDADGHEVLVTWAGHPEPVHVPLPEDEPEPPPTDRFGRDRFPY